MNVVGGQQPSNKPPHGNPWGRREVRQAHLVGIAGAGMRALAEVLLGWGWKLSGSDLTIGPARHLAGRGVRLCEGHAAAHLPPDTELVVHSDAVADDNPELRRAAELDIPTLSYFEMLGYPGGGRNPWKIDHHGHGRPRAD